MNIVRLCDAFEWTYEEYMRQPKWFVDLLVMKRTFDTEHAKKVAKE